jgi:hypothetical protein
VNYLARDVPPNGDFVRDVLGGRVLHLLLTLLLSPIEVSSTSGNSYTFYVFADHAEIMPYLMALRGAGPGRAGSTPSA